MIPALVGAGFLARASSSFTNEGGRSISYETLSATPGKGHDLLRRLSSGFRGGGGGGGEAAIVLLPVPQAVLAQEAEARAAAAAAEAELAAAGVDTRGAIPAEELAAGGGEVMDAFQQWVRTLAHLRKCGRDGKADYLEVGPRPLWAPF